ncbi:MAG: reverse transcriptase domain-containing protein [Bacteroidetes bacterium]|nr:reverse transcriptase domain-containing protein [Bacteroidota bacterium]
MLKLKEDSIKWAIKSIEKNLDTYVFPYPFEYSAINENLQEVVDHIKQLDVLNNGIRPYRTSVTPKSLVGFRITTQLDPLDSIITNAIIYEKHKLIEQNRIDKSHNIVFSFRLFPQADGTMYDQKYNYNSFIDEARKIAKSRVYSHVVITDIADYFPSIYLHNIETALYEIDGRSAHFQTLIRYLKAMHLSQTHKGLPVGPQFSRPIAELVINTIDTQLIDARIKHIRYVDDIYIFCKSENEAYKNLAFTSQILYNSTNLKLNEHKTEILDIKSFSETIIQKPKDIAKQKIVNDFKTLLKELKIEVDPYEDINLDDLSPENRRKIEKLNLENIIIEELKKSQPDLGLISFILINLAKIDNTNIAEIILEEGNLRKIFPQLRAIINYLVRVRSFSKKQKHKVGEIAMSRINGFIGGLEFNRMWLLHLFSLDNEWNNEKYFKELISKYTDNASTRELNLALGRAHNIEYFRENKFKNLDQESWQRRAFIAGISCLPSEERTPWFNSRRYTNRDFLDSIVEKWVLKNPF